MMIGVKVSGIPELKADLAALVPKLRVRALRNALAAGARLVQRSARAATPTLDGSSVAVRKGYRKPGTVQRAISVRNSKVARRAGDVGVFVNVRPAKRGARGARNPNDPFYWRWVQFGHRIVQRFKGKYTDYRLYGRGRLTGISKRRRAPIGFVPGKRFLEAGAARLGDALQIFIKTIGPQIDKMNKPRAPAP